MHPRQFEFEKFADLEELLLRLPHLKKHIRSVSWREENVYFHVAHLNELGTLAPNVKSLHAYFPHLVFGSPLTYTPLYLRGLDHYRCTIERALSAGSWVIEEMCKEQADDLSKKVSDQVTKAIGT